ncbi:MAG: hypothetical protein JWO53_69, partial [Chlamydiia bacterium]|nr:hypothetical protein [Chlamydiia bacterium]
MFDVLSSAVTTNSHLLVEASAGTGKTFTIEHLFIRRLLEPIGSETVCVKEIAIVTFTKACARELSIRIRKALNTAIELLTDDLERPAPEYIEKIRKEGERAVYAAKRKLIDAKCQIDRASISTIHSFAGRLLSEYFQDESHFSEKRWLTSSQLQKIVYDYFELEQDAIATYELQILLKSHGMDIAALIQEISRSLWEVGEPKEIQVLSEKLFQAAIKTCWSEEFVLEKLEALSFQFCDCRSRSNELKPEIAKTFAAFAKLFSEKRSLEEIMVSPLLTSDQFARLKARAQPDDEFLAILRETFDPLIEQISSKEEILARQVFACKKFVTKVIRQKGFLTPQDLLLQMEEAVLQPEFSSYLKGRYRAIFVDEFQDTDPMQWKIFSDTFLKSDWQGFLYLVGDPKQAIYAFRNADIYSYMKAKNSFSEEMKVSLTSNFRSSPQLTE